MERGRLRKVGHGKSLLLELRTILLCVEIETKRTRRQRVALESTIIGSILSKKKNIRKRATQAELERITRQFARKEPPTLLRGKKGRE